MKAIRIHRFGSPEVMALEDIAQPEPAADEVLIRVHAAGVGPWDAWIRSGKSVLDQPLPLTPGSDVSGVAVVLGADVKDLSLGDAVYGVTNARFTDGYAEYAVAKASMIARKPARLSHVEAASVPVIAVTAQQMLFEHAHVKPGDRVLVLGGGGAVGAFAVQLAALEGAQVVATARGADVEYVQSLGAAQVVDTTRAELQREVELVDAVIDTVGGELQARAYDVLKPGGVLISAVSEPDATRAAASGIRASFILVHVTTAALARIGDWLEAGKLQTRVGTVLPLSAAHEAHALLDGARPKPAGKIVLAVTED